MSEPFPQYRNLHAVQEQSNGARHKHGDGEEEQKSLVPLYLDAQEGQVADDSPARSRHRQDCSGPDEARCQQQHGGDQLHDSRSNASRDLDPADRCKRNVGMDEDAKLGEDIDRLWRRRELEEERLQQNDCCDNSASPTEDQDRSSHWPTHGGDDLRAHDALLHLPYFSTKPGQFRSALLRLFCWSLLKSSLTPKSYCISRRPLTICHASILTGALCPW